MSEKKGIKEWVADMEANEEMLKKFEGLEEPEEIVKLAKELGYEFTEDEFSDMQMDAVSGGFSLGSVFGIVKKGYQVLDSAWRSDKVKDLRRSIHNILK